MQKPDSVEISPDETSNCKEEINFLQTYKVDLVEDVGVPIAVKNRVFSSPSKQKSNGLGGTIASSRFT